MRPRARNAAALAACLLAAGAGFVVPTPAHAEVATCDGLPATVVGPTAGQDTTGTEGDDVIVAPLSANSTVSALGGNDTICLTDGVPTTSRDSIVRVDAGPGNDSVLNQTVTPHFPQVQLGTGADHYVGNDLGESVMASPGDGVDPDDDVDVIDTRGGDDFITSGSRLPGLENHDVVSSGAGHDDVSYFNAAGGSLDNGPDPDMLFVSAVMAGVTAVDNVARQMTVGGETALTWTAVDQFYIYAKVGDSVSFAGTDAAETIRVFGATALDQVAPDATIVTGGGRDYVWLDRYLPGRVDAGDGKDDLAYVACDRATIYVADHADCVTTGGVEAHTDLVGVDGVTGTTRTRLDVRGTQRPERLSAFSKRVSIHGGAGVDRVYAEGRRGSRVWGGAGDDWLKAYAGDGAVVRGGRGADFLRGADGPDRLYGGRGRDIAHGKTGHDLCVAEIERECES